MVHVEPERTVGALHHDDRASQRLLDAFEPEADLARALTSGRASPETLFEWAVHQRGQDLMQTTRLTLWDDYVEHGYFSAETFAALRARRLTLHASE